MVDIFEEVDEDLRRDRALKIWQKYGNYIVAAAVAIVVATAAYVYWRDWDRKSREAEGAMLIAAVDLMQQDQADAAKDALSRLAKEGSSGYALLARFHEAAYLARKGDAAGAIAVYRTIAADSGVTSDLRQAATLFAVLHGLEQASPAEVERDLASLAQGPWRYSATEVQALAALKAGDVAKARDLYRSLADEPGAPVNLRGRAAEMLAALGSG